VIACVVRGTLRFVRRRRTPHCLRHGMEARRAETLEVALAAPFTTARPPEAGPPEGKSLLPFCHTQEDYVATMRFFGAIRGPKIYVNF
jgi:hypothetical protein